MASFPDSVVPNRLMPETQREVDGSPTIFNAKDYNVHHRELRAIEKRALSMTDAINSSKDRIGYISSGRMFQYHSGSQAASAGSVVNIPLPGDVPRVSTTDAIEIGALSISVPAGGTDAFPAAGYLTKLNNNVGEVGTALSLIQAPSYMGTNQEIIQYTSKTSTTFDCCTRGMFGTTVQRQPASSEAVTNPLGTNGCILFGGRVTVSVYPATIASANAVFYEYVIEHDAMLRARIRLLKNGASVSDSSVLRYAIMAIGQFDDIDLGALLED